MMERIDTCKGWKMYVDERVKYMKGGKRVRDDDTKESVCPQRLHLRMP
jgi:hypothetical protein